MPKRKYKSNHNLTFSCTYHIVFCPKYRRHVLVNGVDIRLKEIVQDLANELRFDVTQEVMPDHVHLLIDCDPQFGVHRIVKRIKGRSSKLLRTEFPWLKSRIPTLWTNSYFCATCGGAPIAKIKEYVENQKWKPDTVG